MKSQNKQILEYLKNGNSITPIEALKLFELKGTEIWLKLK